MEHLKKAMGQIRGHVWLVAFSMQLGIGIACGLLYLSADVTEAVVAGIFAAASLVGSLIVGWLAGYWASLPLKALGEAISHVSPSQNVAAPQTDKLKIGQEYVSSLIYQLYQIASLQDNKQLAEHKREATQASNILTHLPLPVLVFNKEQAITFATDTALEYWGLSSSELFGKQLFDVADLEFPSDFTLEKWVADCQQNKATDTAYWHQVRLRLKNDPDTLRQFDMAGYYSRDNPKGIEFIVTMFDRSKEYMEQDDGLGFMALAAHELRTPLTLMRGYIEVFEDELEGKLDEELLGFLKHLRSAADQLTAFVGNILNAARIEGNQMSLHLVEGKWADLLQKAVSDMKLRADSAGKTINFEVAPDLPSVGIDSVTIYEVICNLLDNAIKYSGTSKEISVKSYLNQAGQVETLIVDKGVGIPTAVVPTLFEKFQRNHRNRAQITGTGLGLYLSKTIVSAHGGEIWIKSKEGEGTTVGFTVQPFAQLADEQKSSNNEDAMVRTAHGWIKNHSMYRR